MRSTAANRPIEKLVACDRPVDPAIAEQVGQEIIQNQLEPGAWANALAASGGKRQEALAAYARIRMQQVTAQSRVRRAKAQSLEARRLTTCLGIKTVQDLLNRSNRGGQLNLIKPRLSVVWLFILLVGSAGTVASTGRLLGDMLPDRFERWIPVAALICGTSAVAGVRLEDVVVTAMGGLSASVSELASLCGPSGAGQRSQLQMSYLEPLEAAMLACFMG